MTTFQKIKSVIPGTAEHQQTHNQTGSQYGTDDASYGQGTRNQGQSAGEHLGSSTSGTAEHDRRNPMHGGGSYETGTGEHNSGTELGRKGGSMQPLSSQEFVLVMEWCGNPPSSAGTCTFAAENVILH